MEPKNDQARLHAIDPETLAIAISSDSIAILASYNDLLGVPFSALTEPRELSDAVRLLATYAKTGIFPAAKPPADQMLAPLVPLGNEYQRIYQFVEMVSGMGFDHMTGNVRLMIKHSIAADVDRLPRAAWGELMLVMVAVRTRYGLRREERQDGNNTSMKAGGIAALAGVSADHVRLLLRRGDIAGELTKSGWVVTREEAKRWLLARGVPGLDEAPSPGKMPRNGGKRKSTVAAV